MGRILGRRLRGAALLASLVLLAFAAVALARPQTTVNETIQDLDQDNQLEPQRGEPHVLRDNLGLKTDAADPVPRIFFGQLTDFHVIDEESPLRVEWLDDFDRPFTSAYRPQEGVMPQVVNEMIEQIRNTVSPVTHRQIELAMTTGDNTDNTQCNETRWMIDLMDGDTTIDPNSGIEPGVTPQVDDCERHGPSPPPAPNPACDTIPDNGSIYDGVRGEKQYYEPDRSSDPPPPGEENPESEDGRGYSPYEAENEAEEGRRSEVRDFPGLFEDMNQPFRATGLQGLPWYGIFGNHDGLLQGNQPRNLAFEALGVGCVKVKGTSLSSPPPPNELLNDVIATAGGAPSSLAGIVPPDPHRRPLRKSEYIAEHMHTTGNPPGHGFGPDNVASGMGNYAFNPRPGLKFIVLDTINETGGDGGSLDQTQFEWLHDQLLAAETAPEPELVMVFGHHSLRTMNQQQLSPFPPGDQGGTLDATHNGFVAENEEEECDTGPGSNERDTVPGESLHCLLLRHHSVVAFVNGHEHANRIQAFARHDQDPEPGSDRNQEEGGFWEVNTASHIDWPQQSRVIDLVDNRDCSLSIFTTIVDHAGPPMPGGAPPSDGRGASGEAVQRLASIARELSFNEPDAATGEDDASFSRGDARGSETDRNTELVVKNPFCS